MGTDFSHGKAHWGFCGFSRALRKLAKTIGIPLDFMEGYICAETEPDKPWPGLIHALADAGFEIPGNIVRSLMHDLPLRWEAFKPDPIHDLLLTLPDKCEIPPDRCASVASRIREIVTAWPDDDRDKPKLLDLADGLDLAAVAGESLAMRY